MTTKRDKAFSTGNGSDFRLHSQRLAKEDSPSYLPLTQHAFSRDYMNFFSKEDSLQCSPFISSKSFMNSDYLSPNPFSEFSPNQCANKRPQLSTSHFQFSSTRNGEKPQCEKPIFNPFPISKSQDFNASNFSTTSFFPNNGLNSQIHYHRDEEASLDEQEIGSNQESIVLEAEGGKVFKFFFFYLNLFRLL